MTGSLASPSVHSPEERVDAQLIRSKLVWPTRVRLRSGGDGACAFWSRFWRSAGPCRGAWCARSFGRRVWCNARGAAAPACRVVAHSTVAALGSAPDGVCAVIPTAPESPACSGRISQGCWRRSRSSLRCWLRSLTPSRERGGRPSSPRDDHWLLRVRAVPFHHEHHYRGLGIAASFGLATARRSQRRQLRSR
jgi:hypothetical protein